MGLYSNDDGVMVCQICDREMPFKVGGQYYFEAVQFVTDASRDLHENRLALCPICAAKYRHARATEPSALRNDLSSQVIGTSASASVGVELAGENRRIRFVGKHAIDLQAALGSMEASQQDIGFDDDDADDFEGEGTEGVAVA
jgi:hypothetical protein